MRFRRVPPAGLISALPLVLAALSATCGGGPTAPSLPPAPPAVASLSPGPYFFNIAVSNAQAGDFGVFVCLTIGPVGAAAPPTAGRLPVVVDEANGGWNVTLDSANGTMAMRLRHEAAVYAGTILVDATDEGTRIRIKGRTGEAAALAGEPGSAGAVAVGTIDGEVSFERNGTSYSCNGNRWTLSPR